MQKIMCKPHRNNKRVQKQAKSRSKASNHLTVSNRKFSFILFDFYRTVKIFTFELKKYVATFNVKPI